MRKSYNKALLPDKFSAERGVMRKGEIENIKEEYEH